MGPTMESNKKFYLAGVLSALCLLLPFSSLVRGDEILWRTDFQLAARESAAKNRPLFLDIFGTVCPHCIRMDASTFQDPDIVKILNERFIPLRFDGETNEIKIQGARVELYPTLVTASPDCNPIDQVVGYHDAAQLKQVLEKTLASLAPKAPPCQVEIHVGPACPDSIWTGPRWLTVRSAAFTAQPCNVKEERMDRAREMLVRAADSYRRQQWHICLQLCHSLIQAYPDLPESLDARQLANTINPEQLENLGKNLSDNLGQVYWELAQAKLRQGQPDQAIPFLERVVQSCPGSRLAVNAQDMLTQLGQTAPTAKILQR